MKRRNIAIVVGLVLFAAGPAMRSAVTEGFWRRMGDGCWRASAGRRLFGDDRLGRLAGLVPADRPLGVVFSRPQSIYPLLLRRPTPVVPTSAAASPAGLQAAGIEYLLFLDAPPADGVLGVGCRRLWGPSDEDALPGGLYRLPARSKRRAVAGLYAESARMPRRKISNQAYSGGFK